MRRYLENGKRYGHRILLVTNRELHMSFRLAPRSMTLDDLELLKVRIFGVFCRISQIWEATTAERIRTFQHYVPCFDLP